MMTLEMRIAKRQFVEKVWMWIAWRLPHQLVKWTAIRLIAYATQGKYGSQNVPELSAMDALKRWEDKE